MGSDIEIAVQIFCQPPSMTRGLVRAQFLDGTLVVSSCVALGTVGFLEFRYVEKQKINGADYVKSTESIVDL